MSSGEDQAFGGERAARAERGKRAQRSGGTGEAGALTVRARRAWVVRAAGLAELG